MGASFIDGQSIPLLWAAQPAPLCCLRISVAGRFVTSLGLLLVPASELLELSSRSHGRLLFRRRHIWAKCTYYSFCNIASPIEFIHQGLVPLVLVHVGKVILIVAQHGGIPVPSFFDSGHDPGD